MKKIYTLYDSVAGTYDIQHLTVCENDAVALRMFSNTLKQIPTEMRDDFDLVCLGSIDEYSGKIIPCVFNVSTIKEDKDPQVELPLEEK